LSIAQRKKEMAYRTDGSSHHSGVLNEKQLVQILRENEAVRKSVYPECPPEPKVKHLGGTQHKADLKINEQGVSVKKKKELKNGSFDWVNSSAAYKRHKEHFPRFTNALHNPKGAIETVRENVKIATHGDLESFDNGALRNLLRTSVIEPNEKLILSVVDVENKKLYSCDFKDTLLYKYYKSNATLSLKKTNRVTTSRTLLFDGKDIGLRIRVVLNNGINALLGLSKSNKHSIPVIKFQQDKVVGFLDDVCAGGLRTTTL
jgi:hypothetical protein